MDDVGHSAMLLRSGALVVAPELKRQEESVSRARDVRGKWWIGRCLADQVHGGIVEGRQTAGLNECDIDQMAVARDDNPQHDRA